MSELRRIGFSFLIRIYETAFLIDGNKVDEDFRNGILEALRSGAKLGMNFSFMPPVQFEGTRQLTQISIAQCPAGMKPSWCDLVMIDCEMPIDEALAAMEAMRLATVMDSSELAPSGKKGRL